MAYLFVAVGGGLGSIARYGCARWVGSWGAALPYGTFLVNLIGSLVLGYLFEVCANRSFLGADARIFLGTGLMGGFTTYSSFSVETVLLVQRGEPLRALLYACATVGLCLVASASGLAVGRAFQRL